MGLALGAHPFRPGLGAGTFCVPRRNHGTQGYSWRAKPFGLMGPAWIPRTPPWRVQAGAVLGKTGPFMQDRWAGGFHQTEQRAEVTALAVVCHSSTGQSRVVTDSQYVWGVGSALLAGVVRVGAHEDLWREILVCVRGDGRCGWSGSQPICPGLTGTTHTKSSVLPEICRSLFRGFWLPS